MRHLLVTNDFPPKLGGIQSYLWELWRRLSPDDVVVLTTPYQGDGEWDADQPFRVVRSRRKVLLPSPSMVDEVDALAREVDADLVVLDPALPVGAIGPHLERPYGLVLHGAEVTVPGRVAIARELLARTLRGADLVIAAGGYPAAEAERAARTSLPVTVVPPGVDVRRFVPLDPAARTAARRRWGLDDDHEVVLCLSRLVPRKGFDVVLHAMAELARTRPRLRVLVGGAGRDRARLERIARRVDAPAQFLGRVDDAEMPGLFGCADVYAMICRGNRWAGLEQEGFGIVFLEAAAAGIPQVAGRSGGSHEAVVDGETGSVVDRPGDPVAVRAAIDRLLADPAARTSMGRRARQRVEDEFTYDRLAVRLATALGTEVVV
jgi:phosphatidylinositol alpha-1,6-mannosyltransferase